MKRYRIKVVPDHNPDDNGAWLDVTAALVRDTIQDIPGRYPESSWIEKQKFLSHYAPAGFHVVQLEVVEVNNLFPLREIVRNILAKPHRHCYEWTYHGLGMIRCYPFGTKKLRLNVWHRDFKCVPRSSEMHTHPWNLKSRVIAGSLRNHRYVETDAPSTGGNFEFLEVGCGANTPKMVEAKTGNVQLHKCKAEDYWPSDWYQQHADEIHWTEASDGAVTIMERETIPGKAETARIYFPRFGDWIDAAPRAALKEEINFGCDQSLIGLSLPDSSADNYTRAR